MASYKTIEAYNNYLVENQININIIEYVKEVNKIEYKIELNFIDDFIELVSKKECCIHHDMLIKYGVSSLKGTTNDIKKLLDQNNFLENKDYNLRNVSQVRKNRGNVIKNEYYLHPKAFKICLMRSLKTRKYAEYYLLLEEAIKYCNDYQNLLKENYIIKLKYKIEKKDHKIDKLEEKINKILEDNKQILENNKKMEYQLNEALEKLDITTDMLDDSKEELEEVNEKLDNTDKTLNKVAKKLDIAVEDRVVNTKKLSTLEYFIIMKNNNADYKYYVIRGQKRYINKKKDDLGDGYDEIKRIECCPNASILWNLMKEQLKNNIDFCGNKLNLLSNLNEERFLSKVDEIYNSRKNIFI